MKRKLTAVILVVVLQFQMLHASIFGEENATLTGILTEEFIQTAKAAETIARLKALLDAANQTIDLARESYRQFQYIKNYSVDDLARDAKAGFCHGLGNSTNTTCSEWELSIKEMSDNGEMIVGGHGDQWVNYRSNWNNETKSFLKQMYHGSAAAYVYPKIAPNVSKYYGWDKHENDAEYVINQALTKSGLYDSMIESMKDGYTVQTAIGDFLKEAENSKNVVAKGQSVQLMQDQQRNKSLVESNNINKARYLHEENTKTQIRNERNVFLDTYKDTSKESSKEQPFKTKPLQ
ncbi:MAG TPA: hypothetical protein PLZ43_11195 [bacterium]|nr:hypothetical protein [bacterium]